MEPVWIYPLLTVFFGGLNLLWKSRITTLDFLLNVAGPNFSNTEQVSSHLGFFQPAQLLNSWQSGNLLLQMRRDNY